jgi:uncharacterized protein involved in high-affinity Fe2+ transport
MKTRTLLSLAAGALLLAGCAAPADTAAPADETSADTEISAPAEAAPAPDDVAGFTEYAIGDPIEVGPLDVVGVYFQPVDMEPHQGLSAAESDIHMEADISALASNDLGYGAGDFVPFLTVDYEITGPDKKVNSGTFMPMNASDGPHYGANLKMGEAGTYHVKFIIHSSAENGHMVHTDATTGVTGRLWTDPLTAEWDFEYIPREW